MHLVALALALGSACGKAKEDTSKQPPPPSSPTPTKDGEAKPEMGAIVTRGDKSGSWCEYSKDDAKPQQGPVSFESAHWGQSGAPALKLSCASFNFLSSGSVEEFPMKPGTVKISSSGVGTIRTEMRMLDGEGEMVIEAWEAKRIKGSFTVTGKDTINGSKPLRLKGSFEVTP